MSLGGLARMPALRGAVGLARIPKASASRRIFSSPPRFQAKDDAPSAADIGALQEKFKLDPSKGMAAFTSESTLTTGLRSTANIRDKFTVPMDEPTALGGTDSAPNPVEVLLAALGGCQEITYKAYAQAMGIPVTRVSAKLEGKIDLRGFFSVPKPDGPPPRPGFYEISGTVDIESPASPEQLAQLKAAVDGACPLLDIISKPVPVSITMTHKK